MIRPFCDNAQRLVSFLMLVLYPMNYVKAALHEMEFIACKLSDGIHQAGYSAEGWLDGSNRKFGILQLRVLQQKISNDVEALLVSDIRVLLTVIQNPE